MANEERGEVELLVDGKGYTLFLSTNAVCNLQAKTKKTYGQILDDVTKLDFISLREMVFMLLQRYHKKEFKTVEEVGDLVDRAGGLSPLMAALTKVFELNAPKVENLDKLLPGEPGADPQPAQDGIGGSSTLMPDVSV